MTLTRDQRCKDCHVNAPEDGRSRCESCAAKRRERERIQREERRKRGACLTCGRPVKFDRKTKKRPERVYRYCREHLKYYAERQREA